MKKCLTLWFPVLVWAGLIFYLSGIPNLRITREWWDYPLRKAAHMTEYAILAHLLIRALKGSTPWPARKILMASLIACVLYAGSDEYHQTFVVGRGASVVDVMIDTFGVLVGLVL
jgi:VanZ family protein